MIYCIQQQMCNRFLKQTLPVNEEDRQRGHQKGNLMVGVQEAVEEVEVEAVDVEEYGEAAAEKNCDDCQLAQLGVDLADLFQVSHQLVLQNDCCQNCLNCPNCPQSCLVVLADRQGCWTLMRQSHCHCCYSLRCHQRLHAFPATLVMPNEEYRRYVKL